MSWTNFNELRFEYVAYVEGKLVEQKHSAYIKPVRERLKYLVRKHNREVVYQIWQRSFSKAHGGRCWSLETGWVDTDCKYNRTSRSEGRPSRPRKKPFTSPA